ncbi:MAG: nucleotidyl transferase AbiEii/AbiGii toxin family protein [Ardenticatenia bacterium]|nr:nucleotidyl transferase AbiEii/AbiGii toxin family protein [Ardenticatenia bacterium]
MKEYLADLVRAAPTPLQARNVVREYLQARILGAMQHAGAMVPLAFHGGTALRFLYGSQRYSEDLDFALERAREQYNLRVYLRAIETELTAEGYLLSFKVNDRKVVHSAFVRFPGLLYELGLSPHRDEVLAVKIEVDTNPPAGAGLETTGGAAARDVAPPAPRPGLAAGREAARYPAAALSQGTRPLRPALVSERPRLAAPQPDSAQQCASADRVVRPADDRGHLVAGGLRAAAEGVAWERAVTDVRPFLGPGADVGLLTPEVMRQVLGCEVSRRQSPWISDGRAVYAREIRRTYRDPAAHRAAGSPAVGAHAGGGIDPGGQATQSRPGGGRRGRHGVGGTGDLPVSGAWGTAERRVA